MGNAETKQSHARIKPAHILLALDLGELSVRVLWFLSVSLMRRRLFCLSSDCDLSGKDGWKTLDGDARPTFHLGAGYPLSKHRAQLTNESDGGGSEERGWFQGVMMCEGPSHSAIITKLCLHFCLFFFKI